MIAGNPGQGCQWHMDGDVSDCTVPMNPQPLSFRFDEDTNCALGNDEQCDPIQDIVDSECFEVENLYYVGKYVTFKCWDV